MKEKNGKVFGKLNIIDLAVIVIVLAVAVLLVLKVTGTKTPTVENFEVGRLEYVVKVSQVDPEVYENAKARIEAGETQLVTGSTTIDGHVVGIRCEPYMRIFGTDKGELVMAEDPYYLTVYITVQGPMTNLITKLVYSQETRINNSNCVKTEGVQFIGTVIDIKEIE